MLALGLLAPVVFGRLPRLRIPIVVAELVIGVAAGRSGAGVIHSDAAVAFLSSFGLLYLMFLTGTEVDLDFFGLGRSPGPWLRRLRVIALWCFLLTITGSLALGWFLQLHHLVKHGIAVGLVMGSTAITVAVPVLKEAGQIDSRLGKATLAAAVLLDFGSLFLITVDAVVTTRGPVQLLPAFLLFIPVVALVRLAPGLRRWLLPAKAPATSQVGVRFSLALIVALVALAQQLGSQVGLAAFLAGVIISLTYGPDMAVLRDRLDALGYGLMVPVFFIMVGANLHVRPLLSSPRGLLLVAALLLGGTVVTLAGSLVLRFVLPWRSTLSAGAMLASRLTVTIAGATIAQQAGLITATSTTAIIVASVLSAVILPPIATWLAPRAVAAAPEGVLAIGDTHWLKVASRHLDGAAGNVTTVQPEVGEDAWIERLQLESYALALVFTESEEDNLTLSARLREQGLARVLCLVASEDGLYRARASGALGFLPELAPIQVLEAMVRAPAAWEVLSENARGLSVATAVVGAQGPLGVRLDRLELPRDVLCLAIRRGAEIVVPRGPTRLERGDQLTLMGDAEVLARVRETLSPAAPS